ncbi:MAG TPA: protein kinase [Candidatus Polarisedimenticolia bacterium]|jgi:Tol biopolymer transport system component|nr:protein kinase [Candidatus Polarisedimenticolia bacterium]
MILAAGARLGPYEIVRPLGAGGMGEVYLARDTRLQRTVALKVLPAERCASPEARQRFEREARVVSSLSHPHICALFDVGRHEGPQGTIDYLVMEHLEGDTLEERLAKGPLPLPQALRFGIEIADALTKAHQKGIVHRDLKPGNVMLTKSGVKLLDFGLAKTDAILAPAGGLTAGPTQTRLTQEGRLLGTLQYMAPEQLEGKEADARADIFALGAVLYEMAAGRPAFSGASPASLISSIMKEDPPPLVRWLPMSPPALDHAVRTCLAKDPDERWQSASDLKNQLGWIAEQGAPAASPGAAAGPSAAPGVAGRERLAWIAAALCLATALAAGTLMLRGGPFRAPRAPSPMRLSVMLPDKSSLRSAALSPDGTRIVLVARDTSGRNLLWIRPLASLDLQPLPGTDNPAFPFWSPDGRSIGFFADGKLKKIASSGGPPQTVCDAPLNRGGSWSSDGTIIFTPVADGPIYRVPVSGGTPVALTHFDPKRNETTHRWPYFLPDGKHFLFLIASFSSNTEQEKMGVYLGSLEHGEEEFLLRANSNMAYAPPGYILFLRERNLYAQRFDLEGFQVSGDPIAVAEQIQYFPQIFTGLFSVSGTGSLLYQNQGGSTLGRLVWFDRDGKGLGALGVPADQANPRLSPDGRRVALSITDARSGNADVWSYDIAGGIPTRLTTHPAIDSAPVWSPDGSRLAYTSMQRGHSEVFEMASGGGGERPLAGSRRTNYPNDWSPDGQEILYRANDPDTNLELWLLPRGGEGQPVPFLKASYGVSNGQFSPDGRFVAYASNESGRWEIYVAPFPGPGGNWKVSTEGGSEPAWRRDGKELFYLAADGHLMAAPVRLAPTFDAGDPKPLFLVRRREPVATIDLFSYDVSRDGQRFLVNTDAGETTAPPLTVVLDWASELKK